MATCKICGSELLDDVCTNETCSNYVAQTSQSLAPEMEGQSPSGTLLPTGFENDEIIDHSQTIAPMKFFDGDEETKGEPKDEATDAATDRPMGELTKPLPKSDTSISPEATVAVDDEMFNEIQEFIKAQQAADDVAAKERHQTITIQGGRTELPVIELLPPVREANLPTPSGTETPAGDGVPAINDYVIIEELAHGASGVVYRAKQASLNRNVAVKALKQRSHKTGSNISTQEATDQLEELQAKFVHEALITARLEHPNIVPVHDFGMDSVGTQFYSMKLIDQNSWSDSIASTDVERNLQIFMDVCDAIRYAHSQNVIHRDLKPENIMVGRFGEVVVVDWGIAIDKTATATGFVAGGTASYMAPEAAQHFRTQVRIKTLQRKIEYLESQSDKDQDSIAQQKRELDEVKASELELEKSINHSSDIYGLGAILFQIAVGHPPHYVPPQADPSKSDFQIQTDRHRRELILASRCEIQKLRKIGDPLRQSLCNVALAALTKSPVNRYPTVEKLQDAIRGFQSQLQSRKLTIRGVSELKKSEKSEGYQHLLPSMESFREAISLWKENAEARSRQADAACEYASRAVKQRDYDAGLSILDEYIVDEEMKKEDRVVQLKDKLNAGKRKRARTRTLLVVGWAAALFGPLILVLAGTGTYFEVQRRIALANENLETTQGELDEALVDTKKAEADKLTAEADTKQAKDDLKTAKADTKKAKDDLKTAKADTKKANDELKTAKADTKKAEADLKTAKADTKKANDELKTAKADTKQAKADLNKAEADTKKAKADVVQAQVQVKSLTREREGLRFGTQVAKAKDAIYSIRSSLTQEQLQLAQQKLNEFLKDKKYKSLVNGWESRYLYKQAFAGGDSGPLEENLAIRAVAGRPNGDCYVLGTVGKPGEKQQLKVWQLDPANPATAVEKHFSLPSTGVLKHASLSDDGKWLALGMDQVRNQVDGTYGETVWIINTSLEKSGSAYYSKHIKEDPDTKVELKTIGCKYIRLISNPNNSGQLKLVTVQELDFNSEKDRSRLRRVATDLAVDGDRLQASGETQFTRLDGTSRDERSFYCLATTNRADGGPSTAVVTERFADAQGSSMETILQVADVANPLRFDPNDIPTALHYADDGKIFCGFRSGQIREYRIKGDSIEHTKNEMNLHTTRISTIESNPKTGEIISASNNGEVIVWSKTDAGEWTTTRRFLRHFDAVTSIYFAAEMLVTADRMGFVRVWNSKTWQSQPVLTQKIANTTSASIDQSNDLSAAVAIGWGDGTVDYFSDSDIKNNKRTFQLDSPGPTFDTSFRNMNRIALLNKYFLMVQPDGRLLVWNRQPGKMLPHYHSLIAANETANETFEPQVVASFDSDFFVTTHPANPRKIIIGVVTESDGQLAVQQTVQELQDEQLVDIVGLSVSFDNQYLALVTKTKELKFRPQVWRIENTADGRTLKPMDIDIDGDLTGGLPYRLTKRPFIGFSQDSQQLGAYFNREGRTQGTDFVVWSLTNDQWKGTLVKSLEGKRSKNQVNETPLNYAVTDWYSKGDRGVILQRRNREYSVREISTSTDPNANATSTRADLDRALRASFFGKDFKLAYLQGNQLRIANGDDSSSVEFDRPRGMRVFGEQVVVFDRNGFHIVDSALKASPLVARKLTCKSIDLCGTILVVEYEGNEIDGPLTYAYKIEGDQPPKPVELKGLTDVHISPDQKFVAGFSADRKKMSVYSTTSMDKPAVEKALDGDYAAITWVSNDATKASDLLLLSGKKSGELNWSTWDCSKGTSAVPDWGLPTKTTVADTVINRIHVSRQSKKYLAMTGTSSSDQQNPGKLGLWSIEKEHTGAAEKRGWIVPFDKEVTATPSTDLETLANLVAGSITFSEVALEGVPADQMATRMLVNTAGGPRFFMIARDTEPIKDSEEKPLGPNIQIVEINDLLANESSDGNPTYQFSGDGRQLLKTTNDGIRVLMSGGW